MVIRKVNQLKWELELIMRAGIFSLLHRNKYRNIPLVWPFVSFKNHVLIFFQGMKTQAKIFDSLVKNFGNASNDRMIINDIQIIIPCDTMGKKAMENAVRNEIIPYIYDYDTNLIQGISCDGPYELNEVKLKKGDIVIDAGSTVGGFAVVACKKGCIAYAFEPAKDTREKYLNTMAEWNTREGMGAIIVVPYALNDKNGDIFFWEGKNELNSSSFIIQTRDDMRGEKIMGITLDSFVEQNKLPSVDFIKADIEGAERNMLLGAKYVLREFAPKLAICKYHLPDDPKVIKNIIRDANPKYTIFEKCKKIYAYVDKEGK